MFGFWNGVKNNIKIDHDKPIAIIIRAELIQYISPNSLLMMLMIGITG